MIDSMEIKSPWLGDTVFRATIQSRGTTGPAEGVGDGGGG